MGSSCQGCFSTNVLNYSKSLALALCVRGSWAWHPCTWSIYCLGCLWNFISLSPPLTAVNVFPLVMQHFSFSVIVPFTGFLTPRKFRNFCIASPPMNPKTMFSSHTGDLSPLFIWIWSSTLNLGKYLAFLFSLSPSSSLPPSPFQPLLYLHLLPEYLRPYFLLTLLSSDSAKGVV